MKKIINGKIYNTKTAKLIASGNNGCDISDCYRQTEELYKTKNNNYFVCNFSGGILALDSNFCFNNYICDVYSIIEWIEEWNVTDIPVHEQKLFGIISA